MFYGQEKNKNEVCSFLHLKNEFKVGDMVHWGFSQLNYGIVLEIVERLLEPPSRFVLCARIARLLGGTEVIGLGILKLKSRWKPNQHS